MIQNGNPAAGELYYTASCMVSRILTCGMGEVQPTHPTPDCVVSTSFSLVAPGSWARTWPALAHAPRIIQRAHRATKEVLSSRDAGNIYPNLVNTGTRENIKGLVVGVAKIQIGNDFRCEDVSKVLTLGRNYRNSTAA